MKKLLAFLSSIFCLSTKFKFLAIAVNFILVGTIQAQQYTINTVVGGGIGNGSIATSVSLTNPVGVAVDANHNIYIVDADNNCIRKVDANTGIINTIAGNGYGYSGDGGQATNASLKGPTSVALDSQGNVYIADQFNNRIRKIMVSTGIISTIAGNDSVGYGGDGGAAINALLNTPSWIGIDAIGNVYMSDNNRIRKVDANTGIINTIAGNGTLGYSGDGGLATSAQLNYPTGIAPDSVGNVYFVDNNRIRKIDIISGIISTVAGNGSSGFSGDGGAATSAQLNNPKLTVDNIGNIYLCDNNRIRKVDAITGVINTIAGNGTIGFSGDGGTAINAEFNNPSSVAVDVSGNLYINDNNNYCLRKIDSGTGIITIVAGNSSHSYSGDSGAAISSQLQWPTKVVLDNSNNLYIVERGNHCIRKVNASTGIITTIAGGGFGFSGGYGGDGVMATSAQLNYPTGLALDALGNLFIADQSNNRIRKVDVITGIITTVAGNNIASYSGDGGLATNASLNGPADVTLDANGNLYIADQGNSCIRKITASAGIITTIAGNGVAGFSGDGGLATNAKLSYPVGVNLDAIGNMYISDQSNQRIRKIDISTGIINTLVGSGASNTTYGGYSGDGSIDTIAQLNRPGGVAVDFIGNLYVADQFNHRVRKINANTGIITTIAGGGNSSYGGFGGDGGIATNALLFYPAGVAIDVSGNIYIADDENNLIRKLTVCPIYTVNNLQTICNGESYILNGHTYTIAGHYYDTLYTILGCDSIINTQLTVNSLPIVNYTLTADAAPHVWDVAPSVSGGVSPYSYLWSWGDGATTDTLYTNHTYSAAAHYNVCLTATDVNGCENQYCENDSLYRTNSNNTIVQINVSQGSATGLQQVSSNNNYQITIYPNPVNSILNIFGSSNKFNNLTLYDVLGNTITTNEKIKTQDGAIQIDVSYLPSGVYFIRIGTSTQKFVVQH